MTSFLMPPLNLTEEIPEITPEITGIVEEATQPQKYNAHKALQSQSQVSRRKTERCEHCRHCLYHITLKQLPSPPQVMAGSPSPRQQAHTLAQQFAPLAGDSTHSNLYRTLLPIFKVMSADFRQAMTLTLRENLSTLWPIVLDAASEQQRQFAKSTWLAGEDFTVTEKIALGQNSCILKIVCDNEAFVLKVGIF